MMLAGGRRLMVATLLLTAAHVTFTLVVPTSPVNADAKVYHELAINLAAGNGYVRDGAPHIWFMPGYALFVAAIYTLMGTDPANVRLAQALLVGVSAVFTFHACRRLFGVRAASMAFVMIAVLPAWFMYPNTLNAETLVLALVSMFVWVVSRDVPVSPRVRLAWGAAAGAMAGVLALVKPELAVWAAVPAIVMGARRLPRGETAAVALTALLACVLVIAPWTARNAAAFGRFIPFSIAGGVAFWGSAHRPELMDYGEPPFRAALVRCGGAADDGLNARLSGDPKAVESCLWREGLQMAREHPAYWIETFFRRAVRTLFGSHTTYLVGYSMSFDNARGGALVLKLVMLVVHVGFVVLGLAGLACVGWRREGWFLLYLVASKLLVHALIFGTPRYGLHLTPVLAMVSSAAICRYLLRPPTAESPAVAASR